jgi:hypothetical protein
VNGAREGKAGLQSFFMTLLVMLPVVGVPHAVLSSPRLSVGRTCINTTYQYLQSKATRALLSSPAAGRRRLHLRQRNLALPPSCNRPAPSWAWLVYGTSIDRWCASENKTGSDGRMVLLCQLCLLLLRTVARLPCRYRYRCRSYISHLTADPWFTGGRS